MSQAAALARIFGECREGFRCQGKEGMAKCLGLQERKAEKTLSGIYFAK